jgi:hypothetical protein
MDHQCGNCGKPLDEATLDSGVCPFCHARISPFGDVIQSATQPLALDAPLPPPPSTLRPMPDGVASVLDDDRMHMTEQRLATIRQSRVTGRLADPIGASPASPPTLGLLVGIGIAGVMIVLCTLAATSTLLSGFGANKAASTTQSVLHVTPVPTSSVVGLGFPTQNPDPTPLPFNQATPTFEPTSTPFGGPPTPTPTPSPSATPDGSTPPPGPPQLSVTPPSNSQPCPATNVQFTVSNTGGGVLNWAITDTSYNNVAPLGGNLGPGQSTQVTIPSVKKNGKITFIDITDNTSQQVTVQCQ